MDLLRRERSDEAVYARAPEIGRACMISVRTVVRSLAVSRSVIPHLYFETRTRYELIHLNLPAFSSLKKEKEQRETEGEKWKGD